VATAQRMRPVSPTRQVARAPRSPGRWRRRLRYQLRAIFGPGDVTSLLLVWAMVIVTAQALAAAHWTDGLGALVPISLLAAGLGFLLAKSHYSELFALILSTMYSLAGILVISAYTLVENGPLWVRTDILLGQVKTWLDEAIAGQRPANDGVVFVLFLAVLFWFMGHNAAWHVFRVNRVWRVILPAGLVLVTNQFYYQGDVPLDRYLAGFVVLALLLLIRSHFKVREYEWFDHQVSFRPVMWRAFFWTGAVLAVTLVALAWRAPTARDDRDLSRVRELLSGDTLVKLADLWNRLFSSLEGQGIATADYYGGTELQLSGAIQLGDQPVMLVQVEGPPGVRYYWRSTVYDAYDAAARRWRHIRTVRAFTDEAGLQFNIGPLLPGARAAVRQQVTMLIRSTDLIHAAPQPSAMGLPVEAELDCVEDFGRSCVNTNGPTDVAIIRARAPLRSGDSYTVTSLVSVASASALRTAGQDYPDWVLRLYLQGASDVSPRVRELAAQIIRQAGAVTPYDQARAIEFWLRTNIQYNESIPTPPRGRDPIEWFLFEQRQGYCNYYATAMVLMLRSQGIPARMAAGFAQGTWDPERQIYLVRERDAHTWVEVYFPGYGWVEFEPTADEAPINRQDDMAPQALLPTVTPVPTPTPLATATPTLPPPTPEGGAAATPTGVSSNPLVPASPTPSPTPAPSATPPPPPDVTHVGGHGGNDVLRVILLTLGLLALIIAALILLGLFLIWYVEYRGLGGLSAVQRAYARLAIYGRWLGLHFDAAATPDERRRYLVGQLPEIEQPVTTITHTYVAERYAPPSQPEQRAFANRLAQQAWSAARWAFIRRKLAAWLGRGR